jgi:transposase
MEVIHPRCAGADVHKESVVVCVRIAEGGKAEHHVRTFGTTTRELLELSDWLMSHGCTHVALESTGVYWKPVWHVLEPSFELVLANASHIRNVPGRKTDVNDATWIADLLAHGLIRGSFVPPVQIQELRDLTRTRRQLVRESSRHTLRIQKVLEDANIKLAGTISDVLGQSGRRILEAMIAGETDPERLADHATGRLKASRQELVAALRGRLRDHHRFLLRLHLGQVKSLEKTVLELEARLESVLVPFRIEIELLMTIPGVSNTTAHVILAEIGDDMSRFPTVGHLLSWAGLCPRADQSAGRQRSTRIRPGDRWLKVTLKQAAWAAVRVKNSYLNGQFHRLKARRGARKAIVAVTASMLTAAYHMLRNHVPYRELTASHFDSQNRLRVANRLLRRLQTLGYEVNIKSAA